MEKVPYLLVGNNERDEKTVTYRKHGEQNKLLFHLMICRNAKSADC